MSFNPAAALRLLGWPSIVSTPIAVKAFQRSTGLAPDGIVGPITTRALEHALALLAAKRPTASVFFSFREFACGCHGQLEGCSGVLVLPALLAGLDLYRGQVVGGPVDIISGYRCPAHNAELDGAAPDSQHPWGSAADLKAQVPVSRVLALHRFSGIGDEGPHRPDAGLVRHVDVRHASGHNPTPRATVTSPARWSYA
jgi:zinc D-Ala-D-Ala carboxypeptidase